MQNKHRPKRMRKFYEHIAMADAKDKQVVSQSIEWLWNKLRTTSLKLLEIEDGLVLDVGSGKSPLLSILPLFSNVQLICVDLALTHLQRMIPVSKKNRNQIGLILADAEKLPFRENSFDRILCSEVIEHLPRPLRTLYELKRILKGKVVITTPNRQNIVLRIISAISSVFRIFKLKKFQKSISERTRERELSEAERHLVQEGHIHHTNIFSVSELIGFLRLVGFQINALEGSALDVYPFTGILDKRPLFFSLYKLLNEIVEKTPLRRYFTWSIVLQSSIPHQE